ncbi:MAG: glycosyltransferase [Patescibacteria group bacterium]
MKIAIIHDYLVCFGGAEKTFKTLTEIFPQAKVFTLFYDKEIKNEFFPNKEIKTSFLQKFPFKKKYKWLLPFLPIAVESLDFRDFDLVISSCFSFSKGIITRVNTKHICYCYSPTRYLWDQNLFKSILHFFRIWDRHASERVDEFIAISKTVQKRIKKYYKKESIVIYPPVEIPRYKFNYSDKEFFLIVSRLKKYKRIDLAVKAFNKLGLDLKIIGSGPEFKKLKKKAKKNIEFLGSQPDNIVKEYYAKCSGFIFPSEDDFGIAPVEAMSYGKPVLAFRKGGALETIIEGKTGEFFDFQNTAVLADGIRRIREKKYDPKFIMNHAKKFNRERFEREIKKVIEKNI